MITHIVHVPKDDRTTLVGVYTDDPNFTIEQTVRLHGILSASGAARIYTYDIDVSEGEVARFNFCFPNYRIKILEADGFVTVDEWREANERYEKEQQETIARQAYQYATDPATPATLLGFHGQHGPAAADADTTVAKAPRGPVAAHDVAGHDRVLRSDYWEQFGRQGDVVKVKPHPRGKIVKRKPIAKKPGWHRPGE